jgi:hypothetical protein
VIADAIDAGKSKVTPQEMAAATNGNGDEAAEPQPEAPTAEEVAADPQYEQASPGETVEEVQS